MSPAPYSGGMVESGASSGSRAHHRPSRRDSAYFDAFTGGEDPALVREAADRAAEVLVRGARAGGDAAVAERLVHLADEEGIEAVAEVWSGSPADSLGGCLWRLFVLRSWVHADPEGVVREFEAGRRSAEFAHVVAGVADPPTPDELRGLVDDVLRGIATRDFADLLFRAAAFARVVAAGRAVTERPGEAARPADAVRRMLVVAEQLEAAGHLELGRGLV